MKCFHCQVKNPASARFCLNCDSALISRCANCQMELPTGAGFLYKLRQTGSRQGDG